MARTFKITFLIALWAFALIEIKAEYEVAKYCQLVPVGTKFPSFKSCQTFYTCLSDKQVAESECTGTEVFDKDLQMCVPKNESNCLVNGGNPCKNQDATWVGDSKDCNLWHYCTKGEILGSGSCGYGQYFDHDAKMCQNGKCPYRMESTTEDINNLCQIMQNDQFFGDFKECDVWYKCNGLKIKPGKCGSELLYDTQRRMCLKNNGKMCERTGGVLPLTTVGLQGKNCIEEGSKIGDVKVCSIYYECKETKWQKMICPTNQYYDTSSKNCKDRQLAQPTNGCNRCQFSSDTWVNAVDTNCRTYYTCKDGQKIATGLCPEDNYFDERLQYCLYNYMDLDKYKKNNGACYDTSCSTVECKIEQCLADSENSQFECQLKVYVNEKHMSESVCKNALCKDPSLYPECATVICDIDCEVEICKEAGDKSEYECKLEACLNKGEISEDQCKNDLCIDPSLYPECAANVCDIDCEVKKCKEAGDKSEYECKLEACLNKGEISEDQCKNDLCIDPSLYPECAANVCDIDCEVEKCKEAGDKSEYECKLEACLNKGEISEDQCKNDLCIDPSLYPECAANVCDIDCEVEKCKEAGDKSEYECKLEACLNKGEISEDQCKNDLCIDPSLYPECAANVCDIDCEVEKCKEAGDKSEYECKLEACLNKGEISEDQCKNDLCIDPSLYPECAANVCDIDCEVEKCKEAGDKSEYECKLEACLNKGEISEDQCKNDLCIDPSLYPECAVCDIDCELQKCMTANKISKFECHLDHCKKESTQDECVTKLCAQPTSYTDECEIMDCLKDMIHSPFECILTNCTNKGSSYAECKSKICNVPEDTYPECNE